MRSSDKAHFHQLEKNSLNFIKIPFNNKDEKHNRQKENDDKGKYFRPHLIFPHCLTLKSILLNITFNRYLFVPLLFFPKLFLITLENLHIFQWMKIYWNFRSTRNGVNTNILQYDVLNSLSMYVLSEFECHLNINDKEKEMRMQK